MLPRIHRALKKRGAVRSIFHGKVHIENEIADLLHPAHADAQLASVARTHVLTALQRDDEFARGRIIRDLKDAACAHVLA